MRVFYLLAIVFVVDGHTTNGHLFEMNGLFRYYSFHLMMFAFGSGYFFKLYGSACSDLAHRAKKLLVPLYLWNAVYGVGAALLRRFGGFELGAPLSPYTLLLAPITDGEHFVWNLGAWFIFPLFCAQVAYALIRRLSRLWHENEVMTFLLCLIPGCAAVQLCFAGRQAALPLWLLRPMILLPGLAGGQLYRRVLEKRDSLPTVPYLLCLVVLRVLLSTRYESLAYLLSNCSYFGCGAFGVCGRSAGDCVLSADFPPARAAYRQEPVRAGHQPKHVRYYDAPLHGLLRARLLLPRAQRAGAGRGGFQRPRFPHRGQLHVCAERPLGMERAVSALRAGAAAGDCPMPRMGESRAWTRRFQAERAVIRRPALFRFVDVV